MKKYLELFKNYSIVFLFLNLLKEIKRKIWSEIIINSYSQDKEDLIVEKLIDKKKGRFLEIGGYHPKRLSNTYRLYQKGWRGVIVEPNPEVKEIFNKVRPADLFLNIGVGDKNGVLTYYRFLIPALNTFLKEEAIISQKKGHKLCGIEKIKVKRISEIIKENFDFLSIDTEGMDYQILKSWPWQKYRPKVICVEAGNSDVSKFLSTKKYQLIKKTKYNLIFKDDLQKDSRFGLKPDFD